MPITIHLNADAINTLDLTPAVSLIETLINDPDPIACEQQVRFEIDYARDPSDPRELSEIPEVRLWFVRLDAQYPWFPFLLDWGNELSRYVAMLVPHQFSRSEGIQYNPEALELFVMHKIFDVTGWLQQRGVNGKSKVQAMALTLGYEIDDGFFALIR